MAIKRNFTGNTKPPGGSPNVVVKKYPDVGSVWKDNFSNIQVEVMMVYVSDTHPRLDIKYLGNNIPNYQIDLSSFYQTYTLMTQAPTKALAQKSIPKVGERWICDASPKYSGTVEKVKDWTCSMTGVKEKRITIDHDIPGRTTYSLDQFHKHFRPENKPQTVAGNTSPIKPHAGEIWRTKSHMPKQETVEIASVGLKTCTVTGKTDEIVDFVFLSGGLPMDLTMDQFLNDYVRDPQDLINQMQKVQTSMQQKLAKMPPIQKASSDDLDDIAKKVFDPGFEVTEKICECGTDKAGGGIHSDWCPKG